MNRKGQTASEAYVQRQHEVQVQLEQIEAKLRAHEKRADGKKDWGDVVDLGIVADALVDILRFLR